MTTRQLLIIKSSWSSIVLQSQEAGELFYQSLFELEPSIIPLFRNDPALQIRKFISMMTLLVSGMQQAGELIGVISSLAERHVGYGVRPNNYAAVGKALLGMLEGQLGARWDQETQQAWELMYQTVAETMMAVSSTNQIRC